MSGKLRVGVLASGGGTNLQAVMDRCAAGAIDAQVVVVISDRDCGALERAARCAVPGVCIDRRDKARFPTREALDAAVLASLREHQVELVCLAGYLRIMTAALVDAYVGRMMNIHPALLPSFGGKDMWGHNVHQAVLDAGCKVSGVTVHFVELETDAGPIILQRCVPVAEGDTPETLAARILPHEHEVYSEAIQLFAEGRLKIEGRRVRIAPAGSGRRVSRAGSEDPRD
jgi:phosphoribosylglycinamide formyltransferase-1